MLLRSLSMNLGQRLQASHKPRHQFCPFVDHTSSITSFFKQEYYGKTQLWNPRTSVSSPPVD